jgi:hypothetical protein
MKKLFFISFLAVPLIHSNGSVHIHLTASAQDTDIKEYRGADHEFSGPTDSKKIVEEPQMYGISRSLDYKSRGVAGLALGEQLEQSDDQKPETSDSVINFLDKTKLTLLATAGVFAAAGLCFEKLSELILKIKQAQKAYSAETV